ncbi:hypothetical protein GR255_27820, partial [Mycobacterium tuberculosis]|nr:hypothetical protein [Mycobacterium tuberculosis]
AVPVAVALSVLIFFAYLVGGYAAGRMARFAGANARCRRRRRIRHSRLPGRPAGQSESIDYATVVSRLFSGASNAVPVAVALSVLIFFAYLVGGYAAGRMARFAGA